MRARALALMLLVATLSAPGGRAWAQGSPATGASADEEAARHFKAGVRLFQDGNYAGALAEFDEAYRLKPSASALQNIALSQKAMFRYAEAIATLEKMLATYGASLQQDDAKAARQTIDELRAFVAQLTVAVSPADAQVTVDGKAVLGAAERRVDVNVGEHVLVVEAKGHRRREERLTLAGGPRRVEVRLEAEVGVLSIAIDDAEAAINIDGASRSLGSWTGELSAGEKHVIRIYKPGHKVRVIEVSLAPGERRDLSERLGEKDSSQTPAPPPFTYTKPPPPAPVTGPYGFVTATTYYVNGDPDGFTAPRDDQSGRDGGYFGLRGGYRLSSSLGLELLFEAGKHSVGPGCYKAVTPERCEEKDGPDTSYDLWGQRFGAAARYFSSTSRLRFVGVAGFGAVLHRLRMPASPSDPAVRPAGEGNAINGFFLLEGGLELGLGGALVDGVAVLAIDGVNNLTLKSDTGQTFRAYSEHRNATMVGLGLRLGYGQW